MSDDYTSEPQSPQDALDQFAGIFDTPVARGMAEQASVLINDYLTQRQIADANTAAGDAFAANLHSVRSNLVGMVQQDPHATDLALDLADIGVGGMIGTVPGSTPAHAANIAVGMQRDIAHAAVRTLAEQHEDQARDLLDSDRISTLMGDDKDALHGYITAQATARQIDAQGRQQMQVQANVAKINQTAWNYMASLVDPDTGELGHPPGWASKLMADPTLTSPAKAALFDTYGRLQTNGDAETSDPDAVFHAVSAAARGKGEANPIDILKMAGDGLRAADAVYLSRLAADPKNAGRAGQIYATLQAAENTLATPENGAAGRIALERFTNWLVPTARDGADLDPSSKEYVLQGNRMQMFAPNSADLADQVLNTSLGRMRARYNEVDMPGAQNFTDRMSLDQIFSGNRAPPAGDQVINQARHAVPVEPPTVGMEEITVPTAYFGKGRTKPSKAGDQVLPPSDDNVAVR